MCSSGLDKVLLGTQALGVSGRIMARPQVTSGKRSGVKRRDQHGSSVDSLLFPQAVSV